MSFLHIVIGLVNDRSRARSRATCDGKLEARLFYPQIELPHDRGQALDLGLHERAELLGSAAGHFRALIDKALVHVRNPDHAVYFLIELGDDLARGAGRSDVAEPGIELVT